MGKMVQVRDVPNDLHRRLKARAATLGLSISDYVLREIRRALERPTREEILARIATYPRIELDPTPASLVREEREGR